MTESEYYGGECGCDECDGYGTEITNRDVITCRACGGRGVEIKKIENLEIIKEKS